MLLMPVIPANPNAQDQFVDAEQSPTNQVQGPAVQNQAQGPANNNVQIGQNVPMQPPQQPGPVQPVPTGPSGACPSSIFIKIG